VSAGASPRLSIVLATPDCYETIRRTVRYLRAQTVKDRLEIVIVAPSVAALNLQKSELADFFQVRIVEAGSVGSIGDSTSQCARGGAVRGSCFPDPYGLKH
jgi:hypothetical protein